MTINWQKIESLKKRLDTQLTDEEFLVVKTQIGKNPPRLSKIKFQDFLKTIWALYDISASVNSIKILKKDDNKILFHYERPKNLRSMPKSGNPNIVLAWKKFNLTKKNALLQILESEIINDDTGN